MPRAPDAHTRVPVDVSSCVPWQLKRAARREKVLAMQRDEFMRELTREPVVLHWRAGGGLCDILLKGATMDVNGLVLLEETDLTLVSGRKYGLVGRNGIGKTTLLKFLAAHRFDGVPENLQILHIEQARRDARHACIHTCLTHRPPPPLPLHLSLSPSSHPPPPLRLHPDLSFSPSHPRQAWPRARAAAAAGGAPAVCLLRERC